jgi:hypothetical protein
LQDRPINVDVDFLQQVQLARIHIAIGNHEHCQQTGNGLGLLIGYGRITNSLLLLIEAADKGCGHGCHLTGLVIEEDDACLQSCHFFAIVAIDRLIDDVQPVLVGVGGAQIEYQLSP